MIGSENKNELALDNVAGMSERTQSEEGPKLDGGTGSKSVSDREKPGRFS
jgi:hypothetical protein